MILRFTFLGFLLSSVVVFAQEDVASIGNLPSEVLETSGLLAYNGKLITHNDSGNTPQLFEIDTLTLQITRTVTVSNVENVDWEDLTQDTEYIYIGDFGNNRGTREDLAIYRISKSDYDSTDDVEAERIAFAYEDQTDFSGAQNSDWDAEAMIAFNDQLLIFTKQWQSEGTTAYAIPKTPGTHSAVNLGSYSVNGLITGATYNEISKVLLMIGYSAQLQPFLLRMDDLSNTFSFNGTEQKIGVNIGLAQVEGITHSSENKYYISSERFSRNNPPITLEARVFTFSTADMEEEENPEEEPPEEENEDPELVIFREFGSRELHYQLNMDRELLGRAIFDPTGKRISYTRAADIEGATINLSTYGSAVYYLTFYLSGRTISKPFSLE